MIDKYIELAYLEDLSNGDSATDPIFTNEQAVAKLICKQDGIIAGIEIFNKCFEYIDSKVNIKWLVKDGDKVSNKQMLASISGEAKSILHAERVALNYLQRMSAIATITNEYVLEVEGFKAEIYDTRKTTPNLRVFEKMAVKIGGGQNHRFSLSDLAMIKDNHIKAAGSITKAVSLVHNANKEMPIEVECETLEQVRESLSTSLVNIIMLDNMSTETMTEAVNMIGNKAIIEASGNMELNRLKEVAKCGVDRISSGALTHSVANLDISLKM